jgi:GAF domain-containing protein/HAMP domain-containing protein
MANQRDSGKLANLLKTREILNTPRLPIFILLAVLALLSILLIGTSVYTSQATILILAAAFTLSTVVGLLAISAIWRSSEALKLLLFSLFLEISIALASSILPAYSGFPYAILAIALAFSISTTLQASRYSEWIVWTGILGAIGSILFSILAPFEQIIVPNIQFVILALDAIVIIALLLTAIFRGIAVNLRVKLIAGALALSLIPITALALINNQYLRTSIQQQANQSLQVAADQTAEELDTFFQQTLTSIENSTGLTSITDYLSLDAVDRANSNEEKQVLAAFQSLQATQKVYIPSYALLNTNGTNLLDTNPANANRSERSTSYFRQVSTTGVSYVSPVEFTSGSREATINFIAPVINQTREVIGYLRVRYDAHILQALVEEYTGLVGNRSYPILIDNNGLRLGDGLSPNLLYRTISPLSTDQYQTLLNSLRIPAYLPQSLINSDQEDIAAVAFTARTSDFFTTSTTVGNTTISQLGIIKKLEYQPWQLVYLQDQSSLITAINNQNRLTALISTLIAALVAVFITVVANSFSRPILTLTEAAEKVSQGNLDVAADVRSKDEIGILSSSFNSMTRQLKEFIDTLESRVQERTRQLAEQYEKVEFRSRQLQTVADVARGIVSTRELEALLTTVTTLISERFNFYHVGIFLNDTNNEFAVLRAANSAGGKKMLARQHKLQIGQVGIVGYVTSSGNPRIATDVGQDAVFFNNPDLPETKSEMALPLIAGGKTIGALDVQSTFSNAFAEEDIELFSTLADEVAIAINNNQLFEETAKALAESERIHRQYLNQEWSRQSGETNVNSIRFIKNNLETFTEDIPEIKMVLESARPVFKSQKDPRAEELYNSTLAVPILLHGQSIGVIHLQETSDKPFTWSQNDLLTVQEVANQVSQSLENARLFEDTIRRADRERKVLEITSKIRSTNDPQQMLEITLAELRKNLGATKAQIVFNVGDHQFDGSQASTTDDQETGNSNSAQSEAEA